MTDPKLQTLVRLAILTAIIFLLAFTPIGYLKVGVIDITFLTIPVIVGAVVMGPGCGAFLGGVFGLTSFLRWFNGSSAFGAALFGINPLLAFACCMVPRILMGWLCGLVYKGLNRITNNTVSVCISSISGALFNTLLFTSTVLLAFGHSDYILGLRGGKSVLAFAVAFVGMNGLVEVIACGIIGTALCKALLVVLKKRK